MKAPSSSSLSFSFSFSPSFSPSPSFSSPSSSSSSSFFSSTRSSFLPFLLILLSLQIPTIQASDCYLYQGSICGSFFGPDYYISSSPSQVALVETVALSLGYQLLFDVGVAVDPVCAYVARRHLCLERFARCDPLDNTTALLYECKRSCDSFVKECGDVMSAQGKGDLIPDCSALPTTDCLAYDYDPVTAGLDANFECPDPLIRNPNSSVPSETCVGECCVPCPQTHYFYAKGKVAIIDNVVFFVAIISLFASILTVLSYGLMPEKRSYPSTIILCMAIGLIMWYFPIFFLVGDPTRVRCLDPVTQSLPGHPQNRICQFQSTFVIAGILSTVFFFFLLVVNIYMSVIFLSKRMQDFKLWFQPIGWGLPWIFVIAAHASKSTGYSFGISCVLATGTPLLTMLMIPIACLIFPSVILNLHVLIKIFMVAKRRNASLQAILRLQLRSFAFVTTCLLVFLFYWIFIEVDVNGLEIDLKATWIQEWFICVASGNGQNGCASIATPFVPTLVPFAIAEVLVYGVGIVIFGFFCLKQDVLLFWKDLVISGNIKRIYEKGTTTTFENSQMTNRSAAKGDERGVAMQKSASKHSIGAGVEVGRQNSTRDLEKDDI